MFSIEHRHADQDRRAVVAVYAVIEGVEAVGLWFQKRWAEYLTFIATTALLPLEVYELDQPAPVLKVLTLIINVAVVVYLLLAKRLFGLRGGAAAEPRGARARQRLGGARARHAEARRADAQRSSTCLT